MLAHVGPFYALGRLFFALGWFLSAFCASCCAFCRSWVFFFTFWTVLGSIFVACCKSRTSKFMRPRSVLLMLHPKRIFAFRMHLGSEKPTENHSKTTSEPFKDQCQKRCFFQHRFFRVLASILEPLGRPSPPRCLQRQAC